jgi:hypothetical protein
MGEPVHQSISFTHVINPFAAPRDSEHGGASAITFATLRRAVQEAAASGIEVEVRAVVLPGDENAAEKPAQLAPRLTRTIKDLYQLRPARPLPLIHDLLKNGVEGTVRTHVVFTNMDIAVQPHFYVELRRLILQRFTANTPFIVYRRNIDARYKSVDQLAAMYAETGDLANGYDCFIFPVDYVARLDLGDCCIGTAHFDDLLFMNLDALSGFHAGRVMDVPLTFHIGNEIGWTRHMDHIEHNLAEALAAIRRMRLRFKIPPTSAFAHIEQHNFLANARLDSVLMRKLKRLPIVRETLHAAKKLVGRTY